MTGPTRADPRLREVLARVPRIQAATRLRPGARLWGFEKGGLITGIAAMLPEIVYPLPQGAVANAKLLGDFFLGAAVDKNGTQGLEATLVRMVGLAKKVLATAVVHDPSSLEMLLVLRDNPGRWYGQIATLSMKTLAKPRKKRPLLRGRPKHDHRRNNRQPQKRLTPTPAKPRKNRHSPGQNVTHFASRKSAVNATVMVR
jgi:hypothetical protein